MYVTDDDKELNELSVDEETGEIIDHSQKAFSKKFWLQKLNCQKRKKNLKIEKKTVDKMREEEIKNNTTFSSDEIRTEKFKLMKTKKNTDAFKNIVENDKKESNDDRENVPSTSFINSELNAKDSKDDEILGSVSHKNVSYISEGGE